MPAPRNTHLIIASYLRQKIASGHYTKELPTLGALAATFDVTRNTAMRAVYLLRDEGLVDVVQGDGVYVAGTRERNLADRVTDLLRTGQLAVGDPFPSEKELCQRFGVSRPNLRTVLGRLEGQGLIKRRDGQRRIVLALPPDNDKGAE